MISDLSDANPWNGILSPGAKLPAAKDRIAVPKYRFPPIDRTLVDALFVHENREEWAS